MQLITTSIRSAKTNQTLTALFNNDVQVSTSIHARRQIIGAASLSNARGATVQLGQSDKHTTI